MPFAYNKRYFDLFLAIRAMFIHSQDAEGVQLLNSASQLIVRIMGHFFQFGLSELVGICSGTDLCRDDYAAAEQDIKTFRNYWQAICENLADPRYCNNIQFEALANETIELNLDDPSVLAQFLYSVCHGAFLSRAL